MSANECTCCESDEMYIDRTKKQNQKRQLQFNSYMELCTFCTCNWNELSPRSTWHAFAHLYSDAVAICVIRITEITTIASCVPSSKLVVLFSYREVLLNVHVMLHAMVHSKALRSKHKMASITGRNQCNRSAHKYNLSMTFVNGETKNTVCEWWWQ